MGQLGRECYIDISLWYRREDREAGGRTGQRIKKDERGLVGGNGFEKVQEGMRPRSAGEEPRNLGDQAGHLTGTV